MAGAVVMNPCTPGIAVHRIGAHAVPAAPAFVETLHRAWHNEAPVAVPERSSASVG